MAECGTVLESYDGGEERTPPSFPIFCWRCVPHVGVYGDDYTPFEPIAILGCGPHVLGGGWSDLQFGTLLESFPKELASAVRSEAKKRLSATRKDSGEVDARLRQQQNETDAGRSGQSGGVTSSTPMHAVANCGAASAAAAAATAAGEEAGSNANAIDPSVQLELYFIVHGKWMPGPCQKLACERFDEFNVMFHCWRWGKGAEKAGFDYDYRASDGGVLVGAFGANGVSEAHTDLSDGGIPIDRLEKRSVTIHMISFSPANMMLRVTRPADGVVSFFTVAIASADQTPLPKEGGSSTGEEATVAASNKQTTRKTGTRVCITFHALPTTAAGAESLKSCAARAADIGSGKDMLLCTKALAEALQKADLLNSVALAKGLAAFLSGAKWISGESSRKV